jgi:hypothetical protein
VGPLGGMGVVEDGGGVDTVTFAAAVVVVVVVVVETRGRRGVSDVGGGSSEVKEGAAPHRLPRAFGTIWHLGTASSECHWHCWLALHPVPVPISTISVLPDDVLQEINIQLRWQSVVFASPACD